MAFRVVIVDGPAEGWSYVTMIPPDPLIAVAPEPGERSRQRWMRVIADDEPWPNQCVYERGALPATGAAVDEEGDVIVNYELVEQ